jgi:hypothetical protein
MLAQGAGAYAALGVSLASTGSLGEARIALDTINRVLPSMPERARGPLVDALRQLQRKVGNR